MDLRCTCGAVPPSDARFCHKCGRPLFEEDAVLMAEAEKAAAPAPVATPVIIASVIAEPRISFRNMLAVGVSIGVALASFVAMGLIGLLLPAIGPVAAPLILAGGGFLAAVIYSRRTRKPLSAGGGARLGWMTGLWFILGITLLATIFAVAWSGPLGAEMTHQMQSNPQFANMKMPDPKEIRSVIVQGSLQLFFVAILFPMFGGIVGAGVSRNRPSARA